MEEKRLIDGKVSLQVYIIFRVFNLDKDIIDLHLYVDPKRLEERGDLIFKSTSEPSANYSVSPA
jgi:hypothetical protein